MDSILTSLFVRVTVALVSGSAVFRLGTGVGLALMFGACANVLGVDDLVFNGSRGGASGTAGEAGSPSSEPGSGGSGVSNNTRWEGGSGSEREPVYGGASARGGKSGSGGSPPGSGGGPAASLGGTVGATGGDRGIAGYDAGNEGFGGTLAGAGSTNAGSGSGTAEGGGGRGGGAGGSTAGAGGHSVDSGGTGGRRQTPVIPVPADLHPYCSMSAPDGSDYKVSWEDKPCEKIMQSTGWPENRIDRAGLLALAERNFVVIRCGPTLGYMTHWSSRQPGTRALKDAMNQATTEGVKMPCVVAASPQRMPVFSSPFSLDPLPPGFQMSESGYDFATLPGSLPENAPAVEFDISRYSQVALTPSSCESGSTTCSRVVNYRGQDRSDSKDNDRQSFTWRMDAGVPVRALAPGEVIAKRARPVTRCHTASQNELYLRHVIGESLDSRYAEIVTVYYAHLEFAEGIEVGSVVEREQVVGYVGNNGCTEGNSQLQLAVLRESNTARESRPVLDTTPGVYGVDRTAPDNSVARIDPWGWAASQADQHADPGGLKFFSWTIPRMGPGGGTRLGAGAMSLALFIAGQAPPRACDEDDRDWPLATGGTLKNPYAHCGPQAP